MFVHWCVIVLVFVLVQAPLSRSFNVDSRFAVTKLSDSNGSLFGLSVALHQQTTDLRRYLLLVGAPRERAEPTLAASRTGDMFACPISTNPRDCTRTNLISSDPDGVDPDGVMEGMWLGVSVASQPQPGGRVMACGHRYTRSMHGGNILRMIGKCYIRGNNLSYDPKNNDQWQYRNEVCDPNGDQFAEGLCNMGISALMTQDYVLTGAPGCYNWQGNSFLIYRNPKDQYDTQIMKFPDNKKGNIYIGYSVAWDRAVLSQKEDTVVTGAPRDDSKGSVFLAKMMKKDDGAELNNQIVLRGEQIGSYFGNSIALVDLNNDGWKELVVGAPFYFDRRREEGGAVYVFLNENGNFRDSVVVRIVGPRRSGLGMSVSAVGDLNQDGFQDFAAGAPFFESGRVYIWMGSKTGISNIPSQVIEGKDVSNGGFQTFGYSISGGLDVDGNKYPDVVVGSLDNRVALLRSRPVINLKSSFAVTPQIVNPQNCSNCIEVEVCFSYTVSTGDPEFKKNITVMYTVDADLLQRSTRSRVLFLKNNKDSFTGFLYMPSQSCDKLQLSLLVPVWNKVAPLSFSMNVSLFKPEPNSQQQNLQDLDMYPVINQGDPLTSRTEVHFEKHCGNDNNCCSNLQMTAMFANSDKTPLTDKDGFQVLQYNSSVKKLTLLVNVWNMVSEGKLAEDAYNTILNVSVPHSLQFVALKDASAVIAEGSEVCNPDRSDVFLCELADPFRSDQRKQYVIIFETSGISLDTREIEVTLQLSTLSNQSDLTLIKTLMVEYTLQTSFSVSPREQPVEVGGVVVGESAMKKTADIGSAVEFNFTVSLEGKPLGSLGFLQVLFRWPTQLENEKWLLYLSDIQIIGKNPSICSPTGDIVNPLNLTVSERGSRSRRKRDEDSAVGETQASGNPKNPRQSQKDIQLSCESGAKCQMFNCSLSNNSIDNIIRVQARVWNSTLLEDYRDLEICITGEAELNLATDKAVLRMASSKVTFSVKISPTGQKEALHEAPLWIIVVSVLAGVILLGLIIILLWRCGFFRRASTRELYEAKKLKAEMKVQPSETERQTDSD
ncbi:integrin alpha-3 isoform X2 [Hoplias malabaricus]|uniref:integrin alpha-3 isoform X2 n=1 Tax=Hoplias malabaricus TaxID=27720 RepID=UPI003461C53F